MAGLLLYSTNPWIAHEISERYLNGNHVVWCNEDFNPAKFGEPSAPSSTPKAIFESLKNDVFHEDEHSFLINNYKKTFRKLAKTWYLGDKITEQQRDDIMFEMKSGSWKIWRPVLYLIPRSIIKDERLELAQRNKRASIGLEFKIHDLHTSEFEIIEGLS